MITLNGPAHGIVTKTVHKTLPGSGGVVGGLEVVGVLGGKGGGALINVWYEIDPLCKA